MIHSEDHLARARGRLGWFLVGPALSAMLFLSFTGQIWEDFLITYRHTENLLAGHGLVYQPGERVHGFTSVINTLVPALPGWVMPGMTTAFFFYSGVSLCVLLTGIGALMSALRRRYACGVLELATLAALVATSTKIMAFTMNGQEAGFVVGFLALALAAVLRLQEDRRWLWAGLAFAGLLYTRPDSPVYVACISLVAMGTFEGRWRDGAVALGKAYMLAAVLYAPWVVFAWAYYGSPVPHTVLAKAADSPWVDGSVRLTLTRIWGGVASWSGELFGPIYGLGDWPAFLGIVVTVLGLASAVYFVVPVRDRFGRSVSAALFVLLAYLSWVGAQRLAYPWYFPPASFLAILVVTRSTALLRAMPSKGARMVGVAIATGALLASGVVYALSLRQVRIQQACVEQQVRKPIGLWLREHAKPGDRVYVECVGYVGYFSGLKMLDWPGLVSPEVVKVRREFGASFATAPVHLRPEWIVARPGELADLQAIPEIREAYETAVVFDCRPELSTFGDFPGRHYPAFDATFTILHRQANHDPDPQF